MNVNLPSGTSLVDSCDAMASQYHAKAKCAFAKEGEPAFQVEVGDFRQARISNLQRDFAKRVRIEPERQQWSWLGKRLKCEFATLADYEIPENSDKAIIITCSPESKAEVLRAKTITLAQDLNDFGVNVLGPGGIVSPDRLILFQAEVTICGSPHTLVFFDDQVFLVLQLHAYTRFLRDQPYKALLVFAKIKAVQVRDIWGDRLVVEAPDFNEKGERITLEITCASDMQASYWEELIDDPKLAKIQ